MFQINLYKTYIMKTSKKIGQINAKNRIILFFSAIALLVFSCSIIFHITPLKVLFNVVDFAVHHYFLSGCFAILLFSICMKLYFFNESVISKLLYEKNASRNIKLQNRRSRILKFRNNIAFKIKSLKNTVSSKNNLSINKYDKNDVLLSNEQIEIRNQDLKCAMKLGNNFRQNVKLYYRESNLHKCIETAILFVNNEHVTIRGGIVLPIRSIYKVEI